MSSSQGTMMSRPSLGHRSISEQAPLFNPSAAPHSGSRLRGSKATSGAQTATGSVLPFSPLLPLPPAVNSSKQPMLHAELYDAEQTENRAPSHGPLGPSALASRRQARRGVSEGFSHLHPHQMKASRPPVSLGAATALGPKTALRLDIRATSDLTGQPAASKSAGMIRSYSMPVATQEEHDEQQRIMALGLSPVGRYSSNSSWWQYGWPSPGGVNHRHLQQQQQPAVPDFVGERRRPSQSKLATVMTPAHIAAGPSPMSTSPATSRPSSRTGKTHSSCSPKMKNKHLPGIHQHSFQSSSSRSASTSPKMGRSPLSMISVNLPAIDQQQDVAASIISDEDAKFSSSSDAFTPAEAAFDVEMDALNARFAEWSRSQSQALATPVDARSHQAVDEGYFNLVHDDADTPQHNSLLRASGGSDTSDEARTPRASSPRPLSKAALEQQDEAFHDSASRWSGNFDFIHPDHLA